MSTAEAEASANDRNRDFRHNLLLAAEQAYAAGEIDRDELRLIRLGARRPRILREWQNDVEGIMTAEGLMPASGPGAIDWSKFLALFMQLLPLLLKLFMP